MKRGEMSAQERQAERGTSTGSLLTGAELLQSESPYRRKAGSSQAQQPCTHKRWSRTTPGPAWVQRVHSSPPQEVGLV